MISVEYSIKPREVEVWTVFLNVAGDASRFFRSLLSPQEIERADRFGSETLKKSFEVSQSVLRLLLARYVHRNPQKLTFTYGLRGKPRLAGATSVRFNMSHSGRLAAYAFILDVEIGVDIERVREIPAFEQIARHKFCEQEAVQLEAIAPPRLRQEAFFRCWTRKEAYIKAVGDGLFFPLDQFQVTLLEQDPPALVQDGSDPAAAREWTLHHLAPVPGYVGALAYRADAHELVQHPPVQAESFIKELDDLMEPAEGFEPPTL